MKTRAFFKLLLGLTISLSYSFALSAQGIKETKARLFASKFINLNEETLRSTSQEEGKAYHIFNAKQDKGFVIIGGRDNAPILLAYSDRGHLNPSDLSKALRSLLSNYQLRLEKGQEQFRSIKHYIRNPKVLVPPLLKTNWEIYKPPFKPLYKYEHNVDITACELAIAQIMYYYKWPLRGEGSYSDDWNKRTLDFSKSEYKWDLVKDSYPTHRTDDGLVQDFEEDEGTKSIAQLLFDLGAIFDYSKYDREYDEIGHILPKYFKYKTYALKRNNCLGDNFLTTIKKQLDKQRPMLASARAVGYTQEVFIIDGYDENDFVHCNWGRSLRENGFYNLVELYPYNEEAKKFFQANGGVPLALQQKIIIPIPNKEGIDLSDLPLEDNGKVLEMAKEGKFEMTIPADSLKSSDIIFTTTSVFNKKERVFEGLIAIGIYDTSNKLIEAKETLEVSYNSHYGFDKLTSKTTLKDFADGIYLVSPITQAKGDKHWQKVEQSNILTIEIREGKVKKLWDSAVPNLTFVEAPRIEIAANTKQNRMVFTLLVENSNYTNLDGVVAVRYSWTNKFGEKISKLVNTRKTFSLKPRGQNTLMVFANAPTNVWGKCKIDFFFRTLNDFSNTSVIEETWNIAKLKPISIKNPFPPMYYEFFDVENTPSLCLEAIKIEQNNKELDLYCLSLKDLKAGKISFKQIINNKSSVPYKGHLLYRLRNLADSSMVYLGSVDSLFLDKETVSPKISLEQDLSKLAIKEGTYKLELLAHHQGKELNIWSDEIRPYYFVFKDLDLGENDTMCRVSLPKTDEGRLSFSEEFGIAPDSNEYQFKKGTFVKLKANTSKEFVLKEVLLNGVNIYTEGQDIVFRLDNDTEVQAVYEKAWVEVKIVGDKSKRTLLLEGLRDGLAQLGSVVKLKVLDDEKGVFIKRVKVNGKIITPDLRRVEGEQEFEIKIEELTNIECEFIESNTALSICKDIYAPFNYDLRLNGKLFSPNPDRNLYLYEADEVEIHIKNLKPQYRVVLGIFKLNSSKAEGIKIKKISDDFFKITVGEEKGTSYKIDLNLDRRKDLCSVSLEGVFPFAARFQNIDGTVIEDLNNIVRGTYVDLLLDVSGLISNIIVDGKALFEKPLLKKKYKYRFRVDKDTEIKVAHINCREIKLKPIKNGTIKFLGTYKANGIDYAIVDKEVKIMLVPDKGYELEFLLLNGLDISKEMKFTGRSYPEYYIEATFRKLTEIEDMIVFNSKIYPNPIKEFLYIEGAYQELRLYSLAGVLIANYSRSKENINALNLSFLKRGYYMLHIRKSDTWQLYKIYKE